MISFRWVVVAFLGGFAGASNLRAADPVEKLHGTGRALQNQSSSIEYAACSFQESYNFDDVGDCGGDTTTWVPLSQYVACISSFQLDKNNATQYLESMINATKDFYIFTDIAINPRLSEPKTTMVRAQSGMNPARNVLFEKKLLILFLSFFYHHSRTTPFTKVQEVAR